MQKRIFLIALLLLVITVSASALAVSDTRQLNAAFNDIKVYIEGELISPKDALGRPVEPFIVDGTTYLPLRAVAEALGKEVEWDGPNQSVYVGRKPYTPMPFDTVTAKIAIITNDFSYSEEEYISAQEVVKKYGENKVIHKVWPIKYYEEDQVMIRLVQQIVDDPEVKALIINQCLPNSLAAIDKLRETRDDIFLVAIHPAEEPSYIAKLCNLVLNADEIMMGETMPAQAQKLGAKTFVHLSFPRHLSFPLFSSRYVMLEENCDKLGLDFVNYIVPDPFSIIGTAGAQQFLLETIPKLVEQYGKDTAFFCTDCSLQTPLIKAVIDVGAIYPQPCCPSPFHGFPLALGLAQYDDWIYTAGAAQINTETARIVKSRGVSGRISTWPEPISMLMTHAAADYAYKWIEGEVSKDGIDVVELQKIIEGLAEVKVYTSVYEEDGEKYPNWLMVREDYITY